MNTLRLAGATVALALSVTGADASTTLFKQDTSDTFGGNGSASVTVVGGPRSPISALAGGFVVTEDAARDPINSFVAWCLDIANNLSIPSGGQEYHQTDTPFAATIGPITPTRLDQVEKLFETSYATLDLTSNAQSAGFQLALWEILYETDPTLGLTSGDGTFYQSGGSNSARDAANAFIAIVEDPTASVTQNYQFTFWESGVNSDGKQLSQNLVSVSAVPLPAAAGFLLVGLGALGALRARKAGS